MDGMGDAVLNDGSCGDGLPFGAAADGRLGELHETISDSSKSKINLILKEVDALTAVEKLLLYLKLPTENSLADPLKQPINPLGNRAEINLTIQWIRTHLEENPDISLQKKDVYDEYTSYCGDKQIKPLSTADFGKVMKQVYPNVKPRRLGTRGHSQYCYSGLRTRLKLQTPALPDLSQKPQSSEFTTLWADSDVFAAVWCIVKEWSELKLGSKFESLLNLAHHLIRNQSVGVGSSAASVIMSAIQNEQNGDLFAVNSNRHKETIRKIQQKCEGKEQKRKLQAQQVKPEPKQRSKKPKVVPPAAIGGSRDPSPLSGSDGGKLQSPRPAICDTTPDFRNGKVPIPRLLSAPATTPPASAASKQHSPPEASAVKNFKYKHIQPKCDTNAYNPRRAAAEIQRSQEATSVGKFSKRVSRRRCEVVPETVVVAPSLLEDDTTELLSRQRLISVSNVDKDALDEYLGKNNSQETEDEMTHYYENSMKTEIESDKTAQLTQLRSLLTTTNVQEDVKPNVVLPNFQSTLMRRRVSFDPQSSDEVPPSPNTKMKSYSFTPISPGSKSPKSSSSATPSPFVSPRTTPAPRARGNSHPYLLTQVPPARKNKKQRESDSNQVSYAMSAPPSPKVAFNQHSGGAPTFTYNASVPSDQLSAEVSSLLDSLTPNASEHVLMRSQSVPVNVAQNFTNLQFYNDFGFQEEGKIADLMETLDTSVETILEGNLDATTGLLKMNPSRSVPSTPIPAEMKLITSGQEMAPSYSSRSVPSTPMTNDTFQYGGKSKDFLLNGQPIKDKKSEEDIELNLMDMDGLENLPLEPIDNKTSFVFAQLDDNTFIPTIKQSDDLNQDFDPIGGDYFKGVTDG